jgi:hypothetical protein
LQDSDVPAALSAEIPDVSENRGVLFMCSVREIEPKNVHTGVKQLAQDGWSARRRPDRGDDLRANCWQRINVNVGHTFEPFNLSPNSTLTSSILTELVECVPNHTGACP